MQLPGRLHSTTLGDLLGKLHRARVSGVLELVEASGAAAGRAHRVFLDAGLIDDVETSLPAPRLGELLTREGVLPRDALPRLTRRLIAEPGRRAGEILVEERFASSAAVLGGLRRQLRMKLDSLFRLSEALVRFHVRRPAASGASKPPALGPNEFLKGRPRARERGEPARSPAVSRADAHAYRVLGLSEGADADSILRAFRSRARDVHPDRHPHASASERAALLRHFAELSAAYHALTR